MCFREYAVKPGMTAQVKILRFVQEREYQRLGGTRLQKADVRIIAASNRDLGDAVERGTFREDLLYRLQVFDISIAPLRERKSDILPLCEAFLQEIRERGGIGLCVRSLADLERDMKAFPIG